MIRSIQRNKWQLVLSGALAAGLVLLFIKAQPVDPDIHNLVESDLRQLQMRDTELGEGVLQIHYRLHHNYDGVTAILNRMQQLSARLLQHHQRGYLPDTIEVRQALDAAQQQIEQKKIVLEQFKSDNAALKNSFVYIPRMVTGVLALLPRANKGDLLRREAFESLLRNALLIRVNPSDPLRASLSQDIRRVESVIPGLTRQAKVLAENAVRHAKVVLNKEAGMSGLIGQLSSTGKTHIGTEIEQRYLSYYHAQQQSAAAYRALLFLVAMLLLGYAIYAYYRLRGKGRQLEVALAGQQESNERFNQITANIREIVWMTDADTGKVLYVSPAYEPIWGRSLESCYASPQGGMEGVHGDDRQRVAQDILAKQISGSYDEEFRIVRPDGSIRWVHNRAFPVRNSDGVIYRIVGVTDDITDRHQAEEALRDSATKLERSNRELQDFATVASHDLQEPLRKIQTFGDRLQLKQAAVLNEEGREYLVRMQDAAQRMRALIDDLLIFSRVTAKAQPFVPVNLNDVVRDVLSLLELSIRQSAAQIEVAELITLDAEPGQMRQLLQNLISNALKFHRPTEAPRIKIYGLLLEAPSGISNQAQTVARYQLTVQDGGIGFDEKYLDRIFTIFQRLHGREEYPGSGIGLAICRKIADYHGGQITAHSNPGGGARFVVTLPVQQGNKEHQQQPDRGAS